MSVSSQPESSNWKPTAHEIEELLTSLGISPPQSLDENFFPTCTDSCRNSTSLCSTDPEELEYLRTGSRSVTPTDENFDREAAIEKLQIAREDGKFIKLKNCYFHEHLIEHFKKKQMMHVYTDEAEEDVLLNEYLKKLDELERSNEELRTTQDEWDIELSRTQVKIRTKREEARAEVDEMISKERAVGVSTWSCGKQLGLKRVQALIVRQLDRVRDIAKFRLRYTQLRDELISRELELNAIMISSPNLTKEDYERLEAEQFYYKRDLMTKEDKRESLMERRSNLIDCIEEIRRKIAGIGREIDDCEKSIETMRHVIKKSLQEKKIWLRKLSDAVRFIREYDEVIGQSNRPEFASRIAGIRIDHDNWIIKISETLRDIKSLGESLNAVRANLILHGKHLERSQSEIKSLTPSSQKNESPARELK